MGSVGFVIGVQVMLDTGVSGVLVPAGDRAALASAIVATLSRPETLARLSAGARVRAIDFGEQAFAARWGALFNELDAARRHSD